MLASIVCISKFSTRGGAERLHIDTGSKKEVELSAIAERAEPSAAVKWYEIACAPLPVCVFVPASESKLRGRNTRSSVKVDRLKSAERICRLYDTSLDTDRRCHGGGRGSGSTLVDPRR